MGGISYIKDLLDLAPLSDFLLHVVFTTFTKLVDGHPRVATFSTVVSEVTFDFKIFGEAVILGCGVGVYCFFREFVSVVLYETRVEGESADKLVFQATLVHQAEVYISRKERCCIYIYHYTL